MEQDEMKTKKGRKGITIVSPSFNVPLYPVSFSIHSASQNSFFSLFLLSFRVQLAYFLSRRWNREMVETQDQLN